MQHYRQPRVHAAKPQTSWDAWGYSSDVHTRHKIQWLPITSRAGTLAAVAASTLTTCQTATRQRCKVTQSCKIRLSLNLHNPVQSNKDFVNNNVYCTDNAPSPVLPPGYCRACAAKSHFGTVQLNVSSQSDQHLTVYASSSTSTCKLIDAGIAQYTTCAEHLDAYAVL